MLVQIYQSKFVTASDVHDVGKQAQQSRRDSDTITAQQSPSAVSIIGVSLLRSP